LAYCETYFDIGVVGPIIAFALAIIIGSVFGSSSAIEENSGLDAVAPAWLAHHLLWQVRKPGIEPSERAEAGRDGK
jgi:hypothetical protein